MLEDKNILLVEEDRNFVEKAKKRMEELRNQYKEKYIDTGKSQELEAKIESRAKKQKKAIKIYGTLATVVLTFIPADGPFGELCAALATPGLCALVDLSAEIKKKALITGKRALEKAIFKVDATNNNIKGYDLTNNEIVDDFKELISRANQLSRSL